MLINRNTQIGLRLDDPAINLALMQAMKADWGYITELLQKTTATAVERTEPDGKKMTTLKFETDEEGLYLKRIFEGFDVVKMFREKVEFADIVSAETSKYFFICESVYKAAELIKIGDSFSGSILKKVKPGNYTYLMGKDRCVKFQCTEQGMIGFYYDHLKAIAFEWAAETESGRYYFSPKWEKQAYSLMQILAFIELGDIDVKVLESGKNNGKSKKSGKVTNESKRTVYVVDSNWNTITIRTDGFGVRGHFRLQACGVGLVDRKLIWINAFEKHGYTRRPTGEIIK